jgi:hypothetical protein
MTYYRLAVVVALGALLFLVLGIGALGIIGDGRDDQVYVSVLAVAVIGSAVARLRPRGMALAFLATAFAQVLAPRQHCSPVSTPTARRSSTSWALGCMAGSSAPPPGCSGGRRAAFRGAVSGRV